MALLVMGACTTVRPPGPTSNVPSPLGNTPRSAVLAPTAAISASPVPPPAWPDWARGSAVLYAVDQDPDRSRFVTDPASHKTDWQASVTRPKNRRCRAGTVARVTVTFWFLDDRQGRWFPSEQALGLTCGQTRVVRPSRTLGGPSRWLFQPEPSLAQGPDASGVVPPPVPTSPRVSRLPLGALVVRADRPVDLRVRWRSKTLAGTESAWDDQGVGLPSDALPWTVAWSAAAR